MSRHAMQNESNRWSKKKNYFNSIKIDDEFDGIKNKKDWIPSTAPLNMHHEFFVPGKKATTLSFDVITVLEPKQWYNLTNSGLIHAECACA